MIYELRTYRCVPGGIATLHKLMEELAVPLFEKVGMTVVGCWTPEVGGDTNSLVYLLGYEDMGAREKTWEAFFAAPEWTEGLPEYGKAFGGPFVASTDSMFLKPAGYSPLK